MRFRIPARIIPAAALLLGSSFALSPAHAANQRLCFPEVAPIITACIDGRFAEYWQTNGGLAVFGYPITEAREEVNRDTGQSYLTQYFERQRFELHTENKAPYDVLMGRLGDDQLRQQGIDWQSLPKGDAAAAHYAPETGHAIAKEFVEYYRTHGLDLGQNGVSAAESLALFGYPLSEPRVETNSSGDRVLTQYFERARLEVHPDKPKEHRILQGRVGDEVQEAKEQGRPAELPAPPVSCLPTPVAAGERPETTPAPPACVPSAPEAGDAPLGEGRPAETPTAPEQGRPAETPSAPEQGRPAETPAPGGEGRPAETPSAPVRGEPAATPVPTDAGQPAATPTAPATTAPAPSETATPVPSPVAPSVPRR